MDSFGIKMATREPMATIEPMCNGDSSVTMATVSPMTTVVPLLAMAIHWRQWRQSANYYTDISAMATIVQMATMVQW